MGVGIVIKELLKNKNMTAKELSEKTNISINTIYAILKRDNDSIKPKSLMKISKILDVSPNYILGISDEQKENENNFKDKIALINEWLNHSNFKIRNQPGTDTYIISDTKRHIGVYIGISDIDKLFKEIKSTCEYTIDKFIFEQLKNNQD